MIKLPSASCLLLSAFCLLLTASFAGQVSPNLTLSHWSYPLIEKLSNLGLVNESLLNTKPYTRLDAAKMVAEAMRNCEEQRAENKEQLPNLPSGLRGSTENGTGENKIANGILTRLQQEFATELNSLGEMEAGISNSTYLKPVTQVYTKYIYSDKSFDLINTQGDRFAPHSHFRLGFDSYGQYANILGYYLHPEYRYSDSELNQVEVVEGYLKCVLGNFELEVGRDSLWWGPGYNGAWIITDNAAPFDLVKWGNAEPIMLPWIFRWLGPTKFTSFLTQLEEERDYPHTRLWGSRVSFKPKPGIELGLSRSALFGGEGRPSMGWREYWEMFWGQKEHEPEDLRNNQIAGGDFTWQINHLDKRIGLFRTLTLYVDGAGEDFASGGPLPSRWAWLYGVTLGDIGLTGKNDLRIEYANNHISKHPNYWYSHPVYTSGYTYYGRIMGHGMGTDSEDLYINWVHFFNAAWRGSLVYDLQRHGLSDTEPAKVQYLEPQLTYYGKNNLTISAAYRYEKEAAGSKQGTDQTKQILFLNTTYSF
ncbi:MAG: capsule assembly Wzi family protein [bacterium]|nr:capsule assembly Wzi family protein [bacterium]